MQNLREVNPQVIKLNYLADNGKSMVIGDHPEWLRYFSPFWGMNPQC